MSNTLAPPAGHDRQESLSAVYFHANDTEARSRAASKQDGEDAKSGAITANTKTNSSADSTSGEAKSSDGIEMQTSPASPTATLQQLSSPTGTSRDLLDLKVLPSSSLSDVTQAPDFQKSKDGGEHKETCWTRKKGCNRAAVWVIFFAVVGTIDWVVPLFIPSLFMYLINSQVCDKLCVPIPPAGWVENINNPNDWNINKFLSNTNRSWWPEETFSVYLFHINNSDAVLAGTESKLKVQQVGPYVFNTYRLKYNVSFSADNQQVFYNDLMSYTFRPDLSNGLLLTDRITTINLPLVSTNTMEWAILQAPLNAFTGSLCFTDKSGTNFGSCLFQKNSTVEDVLFSSTSELYVSSNGLLQGNLAPTFQMFFNYSTDTAVADEQRLVNSFGLGGKIHTFVGTILSAHVTPVQINITGHPTANDSLLTAQYTGHGGSLDKLFGYTQYKGNSSVNVWNGAEPIRGTDHFQFSLMVTPNDILTVWDDDVMRNVDLQFQEKVSVIGKYDAYRYVPTDSLFGGNDPHYFGTGVGNEGLLTGSPASMIKYGAPVSAFASRPYQAGVNSALASTVICTNCPDMTDPNDWLQVYVDVEPNTGKVLGGKKRGQINALIGQSYIYNNTNYGPYASTVYSKLPLSLVPVVYFEYSSEIESGYQTDQMDDAITQLKLASVGTAVFFYLTLSLAVVNYIQAFVVAMKAWENGTWWWNDARLQHRHAKTAVKTVNV